MTETLRRRLAELDDPVRWLGFFSTAIHFQHPIMTAMAIADEAYINDFPENTNSERGQKDMSCEGYCNCPNCTEAGECEACLKKNKTANDPAWKVCRRKYPMGDNRMECVEDVHDAEDLERSQKEMSWLDNGRGGALVRPPSLGLSAPALAKLRKRKSVPLPRVRSKAVYDAVLRETGSKKAAKKLSEEKTWIDLK